MAQNYIRQSSFNDGDTITASLFNNEYNQLVNAFTYSSSDVNATGHRHDGTTGEGGNIYRIGDVDFRNLIEADTINDRWGFWVSVAGTSVEQLRIQDGVILPVTNNDIDLGSSGSQFKDLYIDGTANIDSLIADTVDINGGTMDAVDVTVGVGKTLDVSAGTLTLADNQISGDKVEGGTINATTINTLTFGDLNDGTITINGFVDEDAMTSNSATLIPTQQSVKAYVDAQVTAQDLDASADSGTISIDLDSETLSVVGGEGIDTSASGNTITISGEDASTSNKGVASFSADDFNVSGGAVTLATTATAAELNTLDGITATTTELNYTDGVTSNIQTQLDAMVEKSGDTMTGDLSLGDNVKAKFGAGNDLQIYHDGSNSYIKDDGTGQLVLEGSGGVYINATGTGESMAGFNKDGAVDLYHNNSKKLATTSTGVNVTGTVTADGLTVDGSADINGDLEIGSGGTGTKLLKLNGGGSSTSVMDLEMIGGGTGNPTSILRHSSSTKDFSLLTGNSGAELTRLSVTEGGDVSFYEDTGTTAKMVWDASAESLGIGTTSLTDSTLIREMHINSPVTNGVSRIRLSASGENQEAMIAMSGYLDANSLVFSLGGGGDGSATERMRINSAGKVGIYDTNPETMLSVRTAYSYLGSSNGAIKIGNYLGNASASYTQGYLENMNSTRIIHGSKYRGGGQSLLDGVATGSSSINLSEGYMAFTTNGGLTAGSVFTHAERMRIDSAGNVGIGTTSPDSPLEVATSNSAVYSSTSAPNYTASIRNLDTTVGASAISAHLVAGASGTGVIYQGAVGGGSSGSAEYIIGARTGSSTFAERMRIDSAGNVGIGTASPNGLLELSANNNGSENNTLRITDQDTFVTVGDTLGKIEFYATDGAGVKSFIKSEYATAQGLSDLVLGVTSEAMRIDYNGNVGIGTASPSYALDVAGRAGFGLPNTTLPALGDDTANFRIGNITGGNINYGTMFGTLGTGDGYIQQQRFDDNATAYDLLLQPNGGNVGIGGTPSEKLHVYGDDAILRLQTTSTTGNAGIEFWDVQGGASLSGYIGYSDSSNQLTMQGNSNGIAFLKGSNTFPAGEAARIDSSGNLLVGTTNPLVGFDNTLTGVSIREGSHILVSRTEGTSGYFNRNGTDGEIVQFRKDGAPVGSIGTYSGRLYIGEGDVGLRFADDFDQVAPFNPATGNIRDNAISLGAGANRFKDLYLSGGVYLGGTGAANKLDDYEEGTWTPVTGAGNISGTSITYMGKYTKVGRLVTLYFRAYTASDNLTVASYQLFSGLPFAVDSMTGTGTVTTEDIDQFDRQGFAGVGGTSFAISKSGSSSGTTSLEATVSYFTS